jgi:hypothetical protein
MALAITKNVLLCIIVCNTPLLIIEDIHALQYAFGEAENFGKPQFSPLNPADLPGSHPHDDEEMELMTIEIENEEEEEEKKPRRKHD